MEVQRQGQIERPECVVEKLSYTSEPAVTIPALLCVPTGRSEPSSAVVLVDPRGKKAALLDEQRGLVGELLARDVAVMLIDVRGIGELKCRIDGGWTHVIAGRPATGMRATDVRRAAQLLRSDERFRADRIGIVGLSFISATARPATTAEAATKSNTATAPTGDHHDPRLAVAALFAAAIDPDIAFAAIELTPGLYVDYAKGQDPQLPMIPRLLLHGDLPHVAALIAPRRLLMTGVREATAYDFTRSVFRTLKASGRLRVEFDRLGPAGFPEWVPATLP